MRRALPILVLACAATLTSAQSRPLVLDHFELEAAPLQDAFEAWSARTGVPLIADWRALEDEGIDPQRPITLSLHHVHAMIVLDVMMRHATGDGFAVLVLEGHAGFLELLTRRQALRRPIVRVYDVRDLLMEIPHFTGAPSLNLTDALSNTNSGGGGQNIFEDEEQTQQRPLTRRQRGEQLAQLIRDTIEPDIWIETGGESASIRYYDGRLIVRAPQYVHRRVAWISAAIR